MLIAILLFRHFVVFQLYSGLNYHVRYTELKILKSILASILLSSPPHIARDICWSILCYKSVLLFFYLAKKYVRKEEIKIFEFLFLMRPRTKSA